MTKSNDGFFVPPYPDDTRPPPGLSLSLKEARGIGAYLYAPIDVRAPLFYLFNLALEQTPPGSWSLDIESTSKILGLDPMRVGLHIFGDWFIAENGRLYHPMLVEIACRALERRAASRERQNKFRENLGKKKRKPIKNDARERIPYADIVALYNELLPNNPECLELSNARRTRLRTLWNGDLSDLERWRSFFGYVSGLPFLTGRQARKGERPFRPNIDWLTKPENYLKIKERGYE